MFFIVTKSNSSMCNVLFYFSPRVDSTLHQQVLQFGSSFTQEQGYRKETLENVFKSTKETWVQAQH